jgi:hypothetical protein
MGSLHPHRATRTAVPLVLLACLGMPAAAAAKDRDHDGLPDRWERRYELSTRSPSAAGDPDRDRLSNRREYALRTNPRRADTDGDGLRDRAEVVRYKTDPRRADTDGDGLRDRAEVVRYKTDPRRADTDGDGAADGAEVAAGTDPLTRSRHPRAPARQTGPIAAAPAGAPLAPAAPAAAPAPARPDYTPMNLSATLDSSGHVELNWDATRDAGFASYEVRRGTDASADVATWTSLYTTASHLTDSGLAPGTYYYSVAERSADGRMSNRSNVVSASVTCASPSPATPDGPDPWGGCFPGPRTTGVPDGTQLTPYVGPCRITEPNTVIDAKLVDCYLEILAAGVQIRNSWIIGHVWTDDPLEGGSFTITDSTVDAGPLDAEHTDGNSAIGKSHFVATRVETIRGVRGVWCEYDCTVRDSWVHGQAADESGALHESGVRMGSGAPEAPQRFVHNTIVCDAPDVPPDAGCSADVTGYGDFAAIRNNTVERNLLAATTGGTCAYGGSSPYKPYPEGSNNVFRDNVFQRGASDPVTGAPGHCGYWYGIADLDVDQRGNEWTGNRWDTGELMPVDG